MGPGLRPVLSEYSDDAEYDDGELEQQGGDRVARRDGHCCQITRPHPASNRPDKAGIECDRQSLPMTNSKLRPKPRALVGATLTSWRCSFSDGRRGHKQPARCAGPDKRSRLLGWSQRT